MTDAARRVLAAVTALALAAGLAGCSGGVRPPEGVRAAPPGDVTPNFQGMRTVLMRAAVLADQRNAAGLRAMHPEIARFGLAMMGSGYPHDVRRPDVPRYVEGRAVFGTALKVWVRAVEGTDDAALYDALRELTDAYWGWVDAYKGLPPERAV